jgi:hypothetical protein
MCKLCNTDREPVQLHFNNSKSTIEFRNIVYEYTGEYPCKNCIHGYWNFYYNNKTVDIDKYIINRIERKLMFTTITKKQKSKWQQLEFFYRKPDYKYNKTIEPCVSQRLNKFKTRIVINGVRHNKTFDTLEEAVSCRDNLMKSLETKKTRNRVWQQ